MLQRMRPGLTFANVTSVLALVLAMGGGAYAITSIPGPGGVIHGCYQKKKGTLRLVPAGRRCARSESAISWNQRGAPGAPGPRGRKGAAGAVGATGAAGTAGVAGVAGTARAYGLVEGVSVSRSKNIAGVTNPSAGVFCVKLAGGVDPSTSGAILSLDHATDSTEFGENRPLAFAEVRSDAADCPGGSQVDVITGSRIVAASGGTVTKVTNTPADEAFFIAVP
jgi:hypothetical protein